MHKSFRCVFARKVPVGEKYEVSHLRSHPRVFYYTDFALVSNVNERRLSRKTVRTRQQDKCLGKMKCSIIVGVVCKHEYFMVLMEVCIICAVVTLAY